MQKQSRSRMDRGRGSADQRNQATISHELQKYSRSRTGKGMNSREVAGRLDPCRRDRDVAGGQRAGAEALRRQPVSRMGINTHVRWRRREVQGVSGASVGDRGRECASVCWAGPYRMGRYVSADVLNIREINKKSHTLQIRIR